MNGTKDEQRVSRRGFLRRNVGPVIMVGALAVSGGVGGLTWHNQHEDLSEQQARIRDLQEEIGSTRSHSEGRIDDEVAEALGIDRGRLTEDEKIIDDIVSTAFTWSSGDEYEQARKALVERHGIDPDSQLLTAFLGEQSFNYDKDKKKVYYIDSAGLNSDLESDPDVTVIKVRGVKYTYDVTAQVTASSDAVSSGTDDRGAPVGGKTSERTMSLRLTIDDEGQVSDDSGDAAQDLTRHSGS